MLVWGLLYSVTRHGQAKIALFSLPVYDEYSSGHRCAMNIAHKYDDTSRLFYAHNQAIKANDVSENGEFKGHAAIFGNVDEGGDMIIEGAFTDTLKERTGKIRVLWNHSSSDPIGRPLSMQEDSMGLFVRGQLNLEVQRGREARALLKAGDIDGMSIGFRVAKGGAEFDEDTEVFKLTKLILREFSIVTFPMNESAIMTSVKSEHSNITTVRQFEEFLLDNTNFTKSMAASIALHGFKSANQGEPGADDNASNAGELRLDYSKAVEALNAFNAPVFHRATII